MYTSKDLNLATIQLGGRRSKCYSCERQDPVKFYPGKCYSCGD